MEYFGYILVAFALIVFFSVVFFRIGKGAGYGKIAFYTNELPNGLLTVIYSDKKTTLLEEVSPKRERYAIVTEAFAGEPIKPKDVVRKIKDNSEWKLLPKAIKGYPPMIKDTFFVEEN